MTTAMESTDLAPRCGNCQTPLAGGWCHQCGQPVKGLVRPLSGWVADFFDSVFDYDGRLPRTLVPLLLRPGFLTREYTAGRRVRYVTPVRLFLFLTIALFLAVQLFADFGGSLATDHYRPDTEDAPRIERIVSWLPEGERQAVLRDALEPPPPPSGNELHFSGLDADPALQVGWLPDSFNASLRDAVRHMTRNMDRINQDPGAFVEQMLGVAPQTLFLMLPVFALLLKLAYVFKRRLYLEHLLVALHSHAFVALALLLIVLLGALATAVAHIGWLAGSLQWLVAALWVWIPVNLFLSQKRIYGQGWWLTGLKFALIGLAYMILLALGAAVTVLLSLLLW
jgi:hypothetical protein